MFFSCKNISNLLSQHPHFREINKKASVDLDVSLTMSVLEDGLGFRPIGYFTDIFDYGDYRILLNPFKRDVIYKYSDCDQQVFLNEIEKRIETVREIEKVSKLDDYEVVDSLDCLPILKHQPGDAGFYITSGITATKKYGEDDINLGIYRIQRVDKNKCHIFLDPQSDGYKNMASFHEKGEACPVTITLGNEPMVYITAAGNIPANVDDLQLIARLSNQKLNVFSSEVPGALPCSVLIQGYITLESGVEAEFGEFKGFYCDKRLAPVLEINKIFIHKEKCYFGLVAGKESGLNLMAFRNEMALFLKLRDNGIPVLDVSYTLEGKGEFICKVRVLNPCEEIAKLIMELEPRVKFILVYCDENVDWSLLSIFPFSSVVKPYYRRGKQEGNRVAMIQCKAPNVKWYEY